jgi:hypothetical protein
VYAILDRGLIALNKSFVNLIGQTLVVDDRAKMHKTIGTSTNERVGESWRG